MRQAVGAGRLGRRPGTVGLVLLAVCALVAAVAAYGWSGLALAAGSRETGHALRSAAWWTGTGLQGAGFALSLIARTVLPLLLVQAAIAAAFAVTAALEHARGVRRLDARLGTAVAAVALGIAGIAVAVVPGHTAGVGWPMLGVLGVILLGCAAATPTIAAPWGLGALSGSAFGIGAIAARLLVGRGLPLSELVAFWAWPPLTWVTAALIPAAIGVGQWALTRALARGPSVAGLGGDYLFATLLPSLYGVLVLDEQLRPGLWPLALLGLAVAAWGTRRLLDA